MSSKRVHSSSQRARAVRRISNAVAHHVADFVGIEENAARTQVWENRRKQYAKRMGDLKPEYSSSHSTAVDAASTSDIPSHQRQRRKLSAMQVSVAAMERFIAASRTKRQSILQRISLDLSKRIIGVGVLGKFMRRSLHSQTFTKDVKEQISNMDDHRPYFTYWVTFVQILIFIVAVSVYGLAPFGIGYLRIKKLVRLSNLAFEMKEYVDKKNVWIGPRQQDLIHLGARYPPCMKSDPNLQALLELDRRIENESACCVLNDGSGCVQRVKEQCDELSTWEKWDVNNTGPNGRISGSVCGQDPAYCLAPASSPPYEWKDAIVDWPVCTETRKPSFSRVGDHHLTCDILGRPCCFGIQGECVITTRDYCDLLQGRYHEDKFLCAQTHCFQQICGMIPFASPDTPDQFYRLLTSLFLHGGLVHLLVTILFQMWIMRDVEKLTGAVRMAIVYIGSGVVGNLASSVFLPYLVDAGPSGSQFGVISCLLVEVLQSYQMYRRPHVAILKLVFPICAFFLVGLLPWFDNWAHLFGFLFGFLLSFTVMPFITFGKYDRRRKIITIVACLGSTIALFICLVLVFYFAPPTHCSVCMYFTCIPLSADFCENMAVSLKNRSSYGML